MRIRPELRGVSAHFSCRMRGASIRHVPQAVTGNGRSISVSARSIGGRSVASARTPDRLRLGEIDGASRLGPSEHRHLGAERLPHLRLLPGRFAQLRGRPGSGPQGHGVHAGTAEDHAGQPGVHAARGALRRRPRASPSSWTSAPASRPSATSTRSPRRPAPTPAWCTSTTTRWPSRTARRSSRATTDAGVVAADLRKPQEILASPEVRRLIDLNRPVALLLVAVLHFVEDADDPYGAVAELRDALAPGSLLRPHPCLVRGNPAPGRSGPEGAVDVYKDIRNPLIMRSRDEIARFFEGYDMVEPGLVPMPHWRPDTRTRRTRIRAPSPGSRAWGARRERGAGRAGGQTAPVRDDLEPGGLPGDARRPRPARSSRSNSLPLARRLSEALRARVFDADEGQAVGAALVAAHCTDPEALSRTLDCVDAYLVLYCGGGRRPSGGPAGPLRAAPARHGRRVRPGAARADPGRAGGHRAGRAGGAGRRGGGPARERGPLPRGLRGRGHRHRHRRPRRQRPRGQRRAAAHVRPHRPGHARPQRPGVDPPRRRAPDLEALRRTRPRRARALPRRRRPSTAPTAPSCGPT